MKKIMYQFFIKLANNTINNGFVRLVRVKIPEIKAKQYTSIWRWLYKNIGILSTEKNNWLWNFTSWLRILIGWSSIQQFFVNFLGAIHNMIVKIDELQSSWNSSILLLSFKFIIIHWNGTFTFTAAFYQSIFDSIEIVEYHWFSTSIKNTLNNIFDVLTHIAHNGIHIVSILHFLICDDYWKRHLKSADRRACGQ